MSPFSIYKHPKIYDLVMRLLYGKSCYERFRLIAKELVKDTTVVDVCAGTAGLYRFGLADRQIQYIGLDSSPYMVSYSKKTGADLRLFDVWADQLPGADAVVMISSLYQFLPDPDQVISKLLAAARKRVLISEPIRNLSTSSNRLVASLATAVTAPYGDVHRYDGARFSQESFEQTVSKYPEYKRSVVHSGGREMLAIFEKG